MTIAPKALLLESIHPVADSILIEAGFQVQRIASALAGTELDRALDGVSVVGIRSKTEMRAAQFANHASLVAKQVDPQFSIRLSAIRAALQR
jgi:D-3-phosphoglycerate dehydrogenase